MLWLSAEEFQAIADKALEKLPRQFLALLENVVIVVEDEPTPEDLEEAGHEAGQELFGLYQGMALPERGAWYANTLPDRIVLFRGPLLRHCRTRRELEEEIRLTLIHELGHYFGLDEADLP